MGKSRVHELCEHLCCVFECLIASIAAVLVFPPRLSFKLWGCARSNIKEWYPELYNPIINHVKPMRCSYEVVFPLYSLPFIYLLFLLCAVLVFRSFLYIVVLKRKRDAKAYYYALLSIPKVAIIHALLAGVLYQSYPYIVMLWSLGANAVHLAVEGKVSMKEIAKVVFTSPMHIAMLTVNMSLLAFALLALSVQNDYAHQLLSENSPVFPDLSRPGVAAKQNCRVTFSLFKVCSAIFHACDCWFTEYLDYFSAFAFILSASFVSFCFTLPWLSGVLSQTRITTVYGLLLVIWYFKHVFSMMQHFDYGYNMFCCIGVSFLTSMMYLFYILIRRRLLGRFSKSDRVLLLILVWTNGSVLLETFDFAPIFWIFDAHSLFHAATIPLPLFTRIFLREYVSENIYQLDKTV
ncbi:hypothetical protein OESDEN_11823 [Oesophagostomum dentatum]|uniref:Post-GPI attachment to proteins factor 3 n=1 Tax=Oesophagostomum dentatum TaxID=61180 RepID=A0A0B1SYV2_OESDE|nr:hypothetical protein OESDEN_11823 [Oesophagostomum dentatum]